jgi:adenine-specific DNA-methyltransferase
MGVHYTPQRLARFLADRLSAKVQSGSACPLRILDPACGDGVLLEALLQSLRDAGIQRDYEVVGVEADPLVIPKAEAKLRAFDRVRSWLVAADFLDLSSLRAGGCDLWESGVVHPALNQPFHIVIANPPYVRTQILGAQKAQELASRYGLTGRVDLYHAFLVAVTEVLSPGGLLGIITSNRFLSTMGGRSIRRYLAGHYDIDEIIDLGDTKLFEAAVLPAIFMGRRRTEGTPLPGRTRPRFTKLYSQPDQDCVSPSDPTSMPSIYDVLRCGKAGSYRVPEGTFKLDHGDLILGADSSQVWCLATPQESKWLDRVRSASWGVFGDVATVRVGVKTTADAVFIRADWDSLSPDVRPEPELLRDILGHEDARRWSLPMGHQPSARVLYPHEVSGGQRRAVELGRYPQARSYLELHRKQLEKRQYVLNAGRKWYEIWVPQDPDSWAVPKIVFPDISPEPRFYVDLGGRIVGGDCYWMTLRAGISQDMLYLLLAVANSAVMARFHDLAFNNRLYSGRRRYITQYVAKYPLPDPASASSKKLIARSKQLVEEARRNPEGRSDDRSLSAEVDLLVESAFGLEPVEVAR